MRPRFYYTRQEVVVVFADVMSSRAGRLRWLPREGRRKRREMGKGREGGQERYRLLATIPAIRIPDRAMVFF
jgi:hypothetical protein